MCGFVAAQEDDAVATVDMDDVAETMDTMVDEWWEDEPKDDLWWGDEPKDDEWWGDEPKDDEWWVEEDKEGDWWGTDDDWWNEEDKDGWSEGDMDDKDDWWNEEEMWGDMEDEWSDWIVDGGDMEEWEFWEDPDWWKEMLEELASMTFDALYDLVCSDTMGIPELEDACAEAEVSQEDLIRTIRGLNDDEIKEFIEEIEGTWEDTWDLITGNAIKNFAFSAITFTAAVAVLAI